MDNEISIKSKERVSKFGEVFTPSHIVEDMLNMDGIKEYTYSLDKTFLEPSCGNGNFLVAILRRKLSCLDSIDKSDTDIWKISLLQAVSTIYGIDIQNDNVIESRERMLDIIKDKYTSTFQEDMPENILKCLETILRHNIVCGNFLTEEFTATSREKASRASGRVRNSIGILAHKLEDELVLMEWKFDHKRKTVEIKAFTLEAIKKKFDAKYEFEPIRYDRLFNAKQIEVDDSYEALGI